MARTEPKQRLPLTCYVASPAGASTAAVMRVLKQREIVPVTPSPLAATTGSALEGLSEAISRADLLIAVLDGEQSNSNVFFELGCGYALRKRVLIVTPPGSKALPPNLLGLPQVTADLQNDEAIRFALDQVVASPRRPSRTRRTSVGITRPIDRHLARDLMGKLDRAPSAKFVEETVVSAITASGINVIVRSEFTDSNTVFDLGIWSDDLDASVGNPLLIEVKANLRDREEVLHLRSQAQHHLRATNARTALVLYLEGSKNSENLIALSTPQILFMPVRELLEKLQVEGFGAVIRELRNRVIHQAAA